MSYPRLSGHCESHTIPASVATYNYFDQNVLSKALSYLKKNNADLVKGDLIMFESKSDMHSDRTAVYDGDEIMYLHYDSFIPHQSGGYLPKIFSVIKDKVPIHYWEDVSSEGKHVQGLRNQVIWFDHRNYLDECLNNMKYCQIENSRFAAFTTFTYEGKVYRIIYDYTELFSNNISKATILTADVVYDNAVLSSKDIDKDTFEILSKENVTRILAFFRGFLRPEPDVSLFLHTCNAYGRLDNTIFLWCQ